MISRAGALVAAVAAAAIVHAIAGHHLAVVDPIAGLVGRGAAPDVVAAAIAVALARAFLFFVAPAWATHVVARALIRAYEPPK